MSVEAFAAWLEAYRRAWMAGDAPAACALFSEDACYYVRPFDPPVCGQAQLADYWKGVARTQHDIAFSYEVIALENSRGVAHWSASFTRVKTGKLSELNGVLFAEFDASGLCHSFREWWHSRPKIGNE